MSFIQKIRDKYAKVAVVAIALALVGFILTDYLGSRGGGGFGGRETTIGEINGKDIDAQTFQERVEQITKNPQYAGEAGTQQAVQQLWQQEVQDAVMDEQYEALGLTVGTRELDQMIYNPDPSPLVRQAFGNPEKWDPAALRQRITDIRRGNDAQAKQQLEQLEEYLQKQAMLEKYNALLTASVYVPKWFLEKRNADNSLMAKASFVSVPYTTIADSTVKVSDAEINDYVKAHLREFELKEPTRNISYVQFSADPSKVDTAAVTSQILGLRDSFQRSTNVKDFLVQNRSLAQFNEAYVGDADLQLQNKDSILKSPNGVVAGPFVENGALLLSKVIDRKTQPDTVKVRHILISLNPATDAGQPLPVRDTVTAKRVADSVQKAIAGGANFDSVAARISDDPGSKFRGGVYDSITRQTQFVPEFKDFAFNNPAGTKGVVKTQFGYHYMEVMNQRGSSPAYQLALFALPIEASPETVSTANNEATMFTGSVKDEKTFNDYYEKNLKGKGLIKGLGQNLRGMDFNVSGIAGSARDLVKEVFKAEKGEVIANPVRVGNNYVVAVVTDVQKEGVPTASAARPLVEPILINKKKAEQIKAKMGAVTDLNAVAMKFGQQVQPADSTRFGGGGALGYEGKVLGAVFNPANKGKVVPEAIAGQAGVYAIRVENTFTAPVENANIEEQRKMLEMQGRQQFRSPVEILQKRAKIKDNRSEFY